MSEAFRPGQLAVIKSKEGVLPKESYHERKSSDGTRDELMAIIGDWGKDPLKDHHLGIGSIVKVVVSDAKYPKVLPIFGHRSNYGVDIAVESLSSLTLNTFVKLVIPNAIASIGLNNRKAKK